jgi:hypothetical protein
VRNSTKSLLLALAILAVISAILGVIAVNLKNATEFSPEALKFRTGLYFGPMPVLTSEWTTPLLEEARELDAGADIKQPIRWMYAHGKSLVWRERSSGDARYAYRLFRAGYLDEVLDDPKTDRKKILKQCVKMLREDNVNGLFEFMCLLRN